MLEYGGGEVVRPSWVYWIWSNISAECTHPCYIDRCALTGKWMGSRVHARERPDNMPMTIDVLEFA